MAQDEVLADILDVITQLGAGGVHARVRVPDELPDDDVTAIAVGLNMLAEELQVLTQGLEAAVAERTSQLRTVQRQLAHEATHDYLTGLGNRRLLYQRLHHQLVRGLHTDALMLLDLDRFKDVNDSLGHNVGDAVLVEVAARLGTALPEARLIARLGGDEFAVLTAAGSATELQLLSDRVLRALEAPVNVDGYTLVVTASIGVVSTGEASSADDLLRLADVAMYSAKAQGRNRSCLYGQGQRTDAQQARVIEQQLRAALHDGRIAVVYQPQVDVRTMQLQGVEALARWPHQGEAVYPPAVFIPVAEQSEQMRRLGQAVLVQACADAVRWQAEFAEPIRFGMSVVAQQLLDPDFPDLIRRTLRESGAPAGMLELDITESALQECPESALKRLRSTGVSFAVDRFGTGRSSLAALRRSPVDALKIDRSFVAGLGQDDDDGTVVRAIIALGRALQLRVVAEGVETASQQEELMRIGCTLMQGYRIGRPMSFDDLVMWVRADRRRGRESDG